MEDKLSEIMKKRARSPTQQEEEEGKRDDGHSRAQQHRADDQQSEFYPSSSRTNDLMSEYRLLLARQDALHQQIRLIESRISLRRMEAVLGPTAVGPGLSSRDANEASILERAREDLLRRERQGILESGRSPYGPTDSIQALLQDEQRDRDLLLSRLSTNPSQGLPDQLLSLDPSRQPGAAPPSIETLEGLMAARSRGNDLYPTLFRGTRVPRNRMEETSGLQRQALSPPRFESDSVGPSEQLRILQQIERQRRINDSLLLDQAHGIDGGSARQLPPTGASAGIQLRDMRGSPATRDFKAGVPMAADSDGEKLSAFQALIRRSLEYFEATEDDVVTSVQGRRQKIRLGQSTFYMFAHRS